MASSREPAPLIILDRDGVINQDSDHFIKGPDEWRAIPGSVEAIARLNQAGWRVVVATNQSGVGRGLFSTATLAAIHSRMVETMARRGARVDAIFFCPHTAADGCNCRKPRTGMFEEIAQRYRMDLNGVPCVGDSLRDLQAAAAVGGRPYLVRTGKGLRTLESVLPEGTVVCDDLAAVVAGLLA